MKTNAKLMLILFGLGFALGPTERAWTQSQQAQWLKEKWFSKQNLTKEQAALLKASKKWLFLTPAAKMPGAVETSAPILSKVTAAQQTLQDPTPETGAFFGDAVLMVDLNGDGQDDAVVGATRADVGSASGAGQVFVFLGPSYSSPPITINDPAPESSAGFGNALAAGDLNGDGNKDLIVGAQFSDDGSTSGAGEAFVFLGGPSFDATSDFTLRDPSPESFATFGNSVATGDIDGDGIDDLIVGADGSDVGSTSGAGEAFVFLGGSPFNTVSDFTLRDPNPEAFASFGAEVATGDVNGDGRKDVIITAPFSDVGGAISSGEAFVFLGGSSFDSNSDFTLRDDNPVTLMRFGHPKN